MSLVCAICGPNGSGKSTFYHTLRRLSYHQSLPFVNADELLLEMQRSQSLPLSALDLRDVTAEDFNAAVASQTLAAKLRQENKEVGLIARERPARITWPRDPNAYQAAIITDVLREFMLQAGHSFIFETVMSHPSKCELLERAQKMGFTTELIFVCTDDVNVNVQRVASRARAGGHDVPEDKIRSRYRNALALLPRALAAADKVLLVDTTRGPREPVVAKKEGNSWSLTDSTPAWARAVLPADR